MRFSLKNRHLRHFGVCVEKSNLQLLNVVVENKIPSKKKKKNGIKNV